MCRPAIIPRPTGVLRGAVVLASVLLAINWSSPLVVLAENSVKIETKWVEAGAVNISLGVFLENDQPVVGVLLPFEIRMIHVGSFIRRSLKIEPRARLLEWAGDEAPLTVTNYYPYRSPAQRGNGCPLDAEGRVWMWMRGDSLPDFLGEEALLYYFTTPSGNDLSTGTDGDAEDGTPSVVLVFDVTEEGGAFEIDTTCTAPHNHLTFVVEDPIATYAILAPAFEKSIVLIGCNAECHGDPNCDGQCNLIDLVKSVDVAFKNAPPVIDPDPRCPVENTDVNCDLVTDILDIVKMVNVQYRLSPMETEFCVACEHIPKTISPKEDVRTPYFRRNGT